MDETTIYDGPKMIIDDLNGHILGHRMGMLDDGQFMEKVQETILGAAAAIAQCHILAQLFPEAESYEEAEALLNATVEMHMDHVLQAQFN